MTVLQKLNICQWKVHNIQNKIELGRLITLKNIYCFCISETWLKSQNKFWIPNYNIYSLDRAKGDGDLVVGLRNSITVSNVDYLTSVDNTFQAITIEIWDFIFISL